MGWSTDFRIALNQPEIYPRYLIERVSVPSSHLRTFGGNLRLSSFPAGPGYNPIITLNSTFQGGRLTPRSWTSQPGSFTLGLEGATAFDARRLAQRGQFIVLKVGVEFQGTYLYEPVLLAQLTGINYQRGQWTLTARGMEGALNSRLTYDAGESLLCHDLAATVVDSNYTATDANIVVTATLNNWRSDGNGLAVMKVTPTSGSPFYITYDPATVTGTGPYTVPVVTAGAFGTTDADAAAGNAVTEVAYTKGHPLRIAKRILVATGTGNNGPDDILPESWGFGIAEEHIDERDIAEHVASTQPASGSDNHVLLIDDEVADGQAFLNSWLNGAGYYLTQIQGQLTGRAALVPWLNTISFDITDDDIERAGNVAQLSYQQWANDSANSTEYARCRVLYADTGAGAGASAVAVVDHHPAQGNNDHTPGGLYSDNANGTAIAAELVTRLKEWDQRTPEIIRCTLIGLRAALLAPGDSVRFSTSLIISRDGEAFDRRPATVLRASPNWFGSTVEVELALLPDDESAIPWRFVPV